MKGTREKFKALKDPTDWMVPYPVPRPWTPNANQVRARRKAKSRVNRTWRRTSKQTLQQNHDGLE